MKINSSNFVGMINNYANQKDSKYSKSVSEENKDKIEISQSGKYLSKINLASEEVNLEKINEIKSKLNSGTYKVDSSKLAEKILCILKGEDK